MKLMFGKTLTFDLTKGKTYRRQIKPEIVKLLLGGRGIGSWLLYRLLPRRIDPLSPDNVLIFSTGPLTGTAAPASSRLAVTAKSPETGILGGGNCGGFWAPMLRRSGFDVLIIKGRSTRPIYLWICDSRFEIRDASDLWGMDAIDTQEYLKKIHPRSEVICIGQAGERLVRFACIRTGLKNSCGRTGMGAVMGSKNLKAIVTFGTERVETAFPKELLEESKLCMHKILERKVTRVMSRYGTPFLINILNTLETLGTRNFQSNYFEHAENISGEELVSKYSSKTVSCFGCPVHCRHSYELEGEIAEGPEFGTLGCLGAKCGVSDMKTLLKANILCNRYGLDTVTTGSLIAWAMECWEKNLLAKFDTELKLDWGNCNALLTLIDKIALREGFGNILAEGGLRASKILGKESKQYLVHVKGLPTEAVDVRWNMGFALGLVTASRGGDHLRSRPTLENLCLPTEVLKKICGGYVSSDPLSCEGKALMVKWAEELYAVTDSLGICRFVSLWNSPNLLDYSDLAKLLTLTVNIKISVPELKAVGERIVNVERLYNMREGVTKKDDDLPARFYETPSTGKKPALTRGRLKRMLDEYYTLRGWTREGRPKSTKIKELQIHQLSRIPVLQQ
ncbi:MAG: aldehyde ferredoxin oxidoreductase family protein [archaeon]|nr:aldehyde ferredoxin oxidoreductase family protein [archaeon]